MAGLVGGEGFAVDASLIRRMPTATLVEGPDGAGIVSQKSSRAVREYLAALDDAAWGAASDVVPKFIRRPIPRPSGPEP